MTLKDIEKRMQGKLAIDCGMVTFGTAPESYTAKSIHIGRHDDDGKIKSIALVHRHFCGNVVMNTASGICLYIGTVQIVAEIMANFDAFCEGVEKKKAEKDNQ